MQRKLNKPAILLPSDGPDKSIPIRNGPLAAGGWCAECHADTGVRAPLFEPQARSFTARHQDHRIPTHRITVFSWRAHEERFWQVIDTAWNSSSDLKAFQDRGFIVAMGQRYYDAINSDPSKAMFDWECEEINYISCFLYQEKFGEMPQSEICRETGSNQDGWS